MCRVECGGVRGIASGSEDGYSSQHTMASASILKGEELPMKPVEGSTLIGKSVSIKGELSRERGFVHGRDAGGYGDADRLPSDDWTERAGDGGPEGARPDPYLDW